MTVYDDKNIEMDNITIDDCLLLYHTKNIVVEINDGHIVRLIKE